MSTVADEYLDALCVRLATLKKDAGSAIATAAEVIVKAARGDHLVYVFGSGHSHMLAEEVHYRAGGPAFTVPILDSTLMVHEGALASTVAERTSGVVGPIFGRYEIGPDDVLFVVSNSGVNAAPLEAARIGRRIGCTVVAITSVLYSRASANGGQTLIDLADIVIDNGIPPGDAIVELPGTGVKTGPASTVVGAAIINAIFVQAASELAEDGRPPIYLSANMPGAEENNRSLVERYRKANRHL